jgi:hypothetical protein
MLTATILFAFLISVAITLFSNATLSPKEVIKPLPQFDSG